MLRSRGTLNGRKRAINKIHKKKKKRNEPMMKHNNVKESLGAPGVTN
jgi:hypothetical protein